MLRRVSRAVDSSARVLVTVRDIRGADELRAAQELQRRAWGITEDGYVLPVATMAGAQKVGGLVLGAFDAENRLIGFAFAFLGKLNERLILYSQLTGVHPAHQSTGVGRALKFEQRRRARDLGLGAVVWAFDPLQASNAAFNLGVLGARCVTYEMDMYGSRSDVLNAGLATDRLLAEWLTSGEPSPRTAVPAETIDLLETRHVEGTRFRAVERVNPVPAAANHLAIEIPPNIAVLKTSGPPNAATDWQAAARQAFQDAFAAGFVADGFDRSNVERPRYLLERA
jgi:predicted GNAT superfamily acetyltransferase